MAAYVTNRFEIYRWDVDTDTFTREQMNTSHANLEDLAAKILEGVGIPERMPVLEGKRMSMMIKPTKK